MESSATRRKVRREDGLPGLLPSGTAQECTRRKKYESSELLNGVNNRAQKSGYIGYQNSLYEPHQDFTSTDKINETRLSPWYKYTSTSGRGVTDLVSSADRWPTVSQSALSEETKADVYYYGFTIVILLTLVCLALYFL